MAGNQLFSPSLAWHFCPLGWGLPSVGTKSHPPFFPMPVSHHLLPKWEIPVQVVEPGKVKQFFFFFARLQNQPGRRGSSGFPSLIQCLSKRNTLKSFCCGCKAQGRRALELEHEASCIPGSLSRLFQRNLSACQHSHQPHLPSHCHRPAKVQTNALLTSSPANS